jgi:hypothetical protein
MIIPTLRLVLQAPPKVAADAFFPCFFLFPENHGPKPSSTFSASKMLNSDLERVGVPKTDGEASHSVILCSEKPLRNLNWFRFQQVNSEAFLFGFCLQNWFQEAFETQFFGNRKSMRFCEAAFLLTQASVATDTRSTMRASGSSTKCYRTVAYPPKAH